MSEDSTPPTSWEQPREGSGYGDLWQAGVRRITEAGMAEYLNLGAETRAQNRRNRADMDRLSLIPRYLGSTQATTSVAVWGVELATPIVGAALCRSRVLDACGPWDVPYLEQIAEGLRRAGSLMCTGMVSEAELRAVVATGVPVVHIVKPYEDDRLIYRHLDLAHELGCVAVGMDTDCIFLEKAWDETPGPPGLGYKSAEQIGAFIAYADLPFICKGVLSVDDALAARDLGAAAVVVSNHGGETIDHTVPVLRALHSIDAAATGLSSLWADSGFRRGADVVKALALGADVVGMVTALLVACAASGADGVEQMMAILQAEVQRTTSSLGAASVGELDRSVLTDVTGL